MPTRGQGTKINLRKLPARGTKLTATGASVIAHQTEEDLELYALGRLSEARLESVEEHLLVCEVCRNMLDEVESFAIAMRTAIEAEPIPAEKPGWFQRLRIHWPAGEFPEFRFAQRGWAGGLALAGIAAMAISAGLFLHSGGAPLVPLASLQRVPDGCDRPAAGQSKRSEVLDSAGKVLWSGPLAGDRIALKQPLAFGTYLVRSFDESGKLLHEYAFQVQN